MRGSQHAGAAGMSAPCGRDRIPNLFRGNGSQIVDLCVSSRLNVIQKNYSFVGYGAEGR